MKEQIIKILSELRPEFDFTQDVDFIEEGMLDSFDIVTLVDTIEEELGVAISVTISNESNIPSSIKSTS